VSLWSKTKAGDLNERTCCCAPSRFAGAVVDYHPTQLRTKEAKEIGSLSRIVKALHGIGGDQHCMSACMSSGEALRNVTQTQILLHEVVWCGRADCARKVQNRRV